MRRILSLLVVALLVALPLRAQTTANGSVRGVAKDQDGAVLPGVAVSATSATVPGLYRRRRIASASIDSRVCRRAITRSWRR